MLNISLFQEKDSDLPVCSPFSVCGKVDTYGTPWMEKQCRCPGSPCSTSTHARDGHTIHDRTKQYKVRINHFYIPCMTQLCRFTWLASHWSPAIGEWCLVSDGLCNFQSVGPVVVTQCVPNLAPDFLLTNHNNNLYCRFASRLRSWKNVNISATSRGPT